MPHVVITGASRGLGRAMVPEFLRRGWTVSGCGRSEQAMAELQAECGEPNYFRSVDVVSDQSVADWAASVIDRTGAPHLVLNNAALINKNAYLWQVPADEFSAVIDVNIKGVANVCRHFLPAMIERQSGVVVNFSSGWGRSTSAEVAPYCATKFAIEGMTKALAQELPGGMAAIPLSPGVINTDMLQSCMAGGANGFPTADVWAKTAVPFLLELGPKDNGQSLRID